MPIFSVDDVGSFFLKMKVRNDGNHQANMLPASTSLLGDARGLANRFQKKYAGLPKTITISARSSLWTRSGTPDFDDS
jgi:hypothetical protein